MVMPTMHCDHCQRSLPCERFGAPGRCYDCSRRDRDSETDQEAVARLLDNYYLADYHGRAARDDATVLRAFEQLLINARLEAVRRALALALDCVVPDGNPDEARRRIQSLIQQATGARP